MSLTCMVQMGEGLRQTEGCSSLTVIRLTLRVSESKRKSYATRRLSKRSLYIDSAGLTADTARICEVSLENMDTVLGGDMSYEVICTARKHRISMLGRGVHI